MRSHENGNRIPAIVATERPGREKGFMWGEGGGLWGLGDPEVNGGEGGEVGYRRLNEVGSRGSSERVSWGLVLS